MSVTRVRSIKVTVEIVTNYGTTEDEFEQGEDETLEELFARARAASELRTEQD